MLTPEVQQMTALGIVALAAGSTLWRAWRSARGNGNKSGAGCPGCGQCGPPRKAASPARPSPQAMPLVTLSVVTRSAKNPPRDFNPSLASATVLPDGAMDLPFVPGTVREDGRPAERVIETFGVS
jgi:hypothetical protein